MTIETAKTLIVQKPLKALIVQKPLKALGVQKPLKALKAQKGASFFTTVLMLAIIGFGLLAGLKLAPAYIDNNVIINAVEGVRANHDVSSMTISQLRSEVMRTVNVNGIRNFSAESIVFTREGSNDYIDVNYETRVPLFYNIDAMVRFENRFDR